MVRALEKIMGQRIPRQTLAGFDYAAAPPPREPAGNAQAQGGFRRSGGRGAPMRRNEGHTDRRESPTGRPAHVTDRPAAPSNRSSQPTARPSASAERRPSDNRPTANPGASHAPAAASSTKPSRWQYRSSRRSSTGR